MVAAVHIHRSSPRDIVAGGSGSFTAQHDRCRVATYRCYSSRDIVAGRRYSPREIVAGRRLDWWPATGSNQALSTDAVPCRWAVAQRLRNRLWLVTSCRLPV